MSTKISAIGPANIAFIKYWGQKDSDMVLPYNDSFSMNLSQCTTHVTIEFFEDTSIREVYIKNDQTDTFDKASEKAQNMLEAYFERLHTLYSLEPQGYRVYSAPTFPIGAGIASSAAFFSAIACVMNEHYQLHLSVQNVSVLARLSGSGSACRSIPDGFVWWNAGNSSETSFAESVQDEKYWDVADSVLIFSDKHKKTGSQSGHGGATTSPFFKARQQQLHERLKTIRKAFDEKNFSLFGELIESDALSMHAVMMTQRDPLIYWSGETIKAIHAVQEARKAGIQVYFTIDAGQNVHLIHFFQDASRIQEYMQRAFPEAQILLNRPCSGAYITHSHII